MLWTIIKHVNHNITEANCFYHQEDVGQNTQCTMPQKYSISVKGVSFGLRSVKP